MRTLPLAPGDDVTVHIVLNDFGPLGQAYVETDEAKADEATIIEKHPERSVFAPGTGGRVQHRRRLGV